MLLAGLAVLIPAAVAQAYIYWAGSATQIPGPSKIGRANLDGTGADNNFIDVGSGVFGLALDDAHVYWNRASDGAIGRANLDGTAVDNAFIPAISQTCCVAVDSAHLYMGILQSGTSSETIGRANLDGTGGDPSFITGVQSLYGIAVDSAHVYWGWADANGYGVIGRANLDGTAVDQQFITTGGYFGGFAVDGAHIYWTDPIGEQIDRANLDGTNRVHLIFTGAYVAGIAVDSGHVYWSNRGTIGRANLDGTGIDEQFIRGVPDSRYLAVDALTPPPAPTQGSTVNVVPRKGKVSVRLPTGATVPLESVGQQIPVGSTLDTSHGTVRLFAATNHSGRTQHGDFSGGLFSVSQGRKNPLTTLSMTGGGLASCGKLPPGGSPKVAAARKHKRRSLFSSVKGHFSVRGRNSEATVRGTKFTMTDTCAGTRTQVEAGTVSVRDFWLRKTVKVKAGHSYLARRGNR